jgi:hypothetical protein
MISIPLTKKIDLLKSSGNAEMASLVSTTSISLTKMGVPDGHTAKVALCLDISGSMSSLFNNGTVSDIVKKSLAQGIAFDDDGKIDVFTFGEGAYYEGEIGVDEFEDFSSKLKRKTLESATYYCKAVDLIIDHYGDDKSGLPVYVIFVTDGSPTSKERAEKAIVRASSKGVFFQFVGVGDRDYFPGELPAPQVEKKSFLGGLFSSSSSQAASVPSTFEFLAKLDNLSGRLVDNAGFFAVRDPKSLDNSKLYDNLLREYPSWLKAARGKNLIQ